MATTNRLGGWAIALGLLLAVGGARAASDGPIKWHVDDYAGALAEARAEGKPLVIDLWAPWCHTCLSMQHTVLKGPEVAALADRFVWLAMDTDRSVNAEPLSRFPPEVWPTFFVVDPRDETIQSRQLGAVDARTFVAFLEEGAAGVGVASTAGAAKSAAALARDGDRHAAADAYGAAARAYAGALAAAPADWPRRPAVRVAQIGALYRSEQYAACLALAEKGLDEAMVGHTAAGPDFVYYAQACTAKAPSAVAHGALRVRLSKALDAVIDDAQAPLAIDDRGEALRIARVVAEARGEGEAAKAYALRQRALLDEAARAATPAVAMTWHWPRAEVYAYLGVPGELVADLERSVSALPDEYDPPYRLAWIQLQAKQPDKARVAALRALERVYGPRKARVWQLLARIERARGEATAERAALQGAISTLEALPTSQRRPGALTAAREALAEFESRSRAQ